MTEQTLTMVEAVEVLVEQDQTAKTKQMANLHTEVLVLHQT